MVNENIIPKTETIYELKEKYEIPSFEEFLKTYKSDKTVENSYWSEIDNYDNIRSYGPCTDGRPASQCHCSTEELQRQFWQEKLRMQREEEQRREQQLHNRSFYLKIAIREPGFIESLVGEYFVMDGVGHRLNSFEIRAFWAAEEYLKEIIPKNHITFNNSWRKQQTIVIIEEAIRKHRSGGRVDETIYVE